MGHQTEEFQLFYNKCILMLLLISENSFRKVVLSSKKALRSGRKNAKSFQYLIQIQTYRGNWCYLKSYV